MVSLGGLMRTLSVARYPHTPLIARLTGKRKAITFKNGYKFRLTWRQFTILRDNYDLVQKYHLEQVDEETFKFSNGRFTFVGSPVLMCIVSEMDSGVYNCECSGKTVLDIGGFQGESAVFFSGMGARKVVVYEPVVANLRFITENIALNHVDAEIHDEGIGIEDGEVTVPYEEANNIFGLFHKGPNEMKIKIRNISNVIKESGAEIAKFDCEGAEESLTSVPTERLRQIELYFIEAHTLQIKKALKQKFENAGFMLIKDAQENESISLISLRRK
jgi:FkbM family methyltransferase